MFVQEGTVKVFDAELGVTVRTLVTANPQGWSNVEQEDKAGRWRTFIGLDTSQDGPIVAGDSKGKLYILDSRASTPVFVTQSHKPNMKIQSVNINPVDTNLILTAGNDYFARIHDLRKIGTSEVIHNAQRLTSAELTNFEHPRVINAADFSPLTGKKILTTCQDNRMRVWDHWPTSSVSDGTPDREIIHSHNFNRHLTPFRAVFDPKDPSERLTMIGRYISEDYGGIALHPIDQFDCATGKLLSSLVDPNLSTICPLNKYHPTRDVIITGSSRSLYCWKPSKGEDSNEEAVVPSLDVPSGSRRVPLGSSDFMFFDATEEKMKKRTK